MKIVAYTALHYGSPYLRWAIRSIIDYVDEYYVFYSARPSYGVATDLPCPDSRERLFTEALIGAGGKLRWYDGVWHAENQHRSAIFEVPGAKDANIVVILDADEIWSAGAISGAIEQARRFQVRNLRVPMVHFWRSFHRAILHDPAYPERIICPHITGHSENTADVGRARISHLGYSLPIDITQYKWRIHGHQSQYRKDCDWFEERFLSNADRDLHPVGSDYWNAERVNPADYMPAWMQEHPYWSREVIS